MTLWFVFALMTAAAIFAVLWPLGRSTRSSSSMRSSSDLAVYRDQLDEIARDRATGLIGEPEAQAARVEVSRRLIAAADAQEASAVTAVPGGTFRRRAAALTVLIAPPALARALCLKNGSPALPRPP